MPWLRPVLLVLLLAVVMVLPCCTCGSSFFMVGFLSTRAHCADIGSLSPHSLKLPFIIGNKKVCSSEQSPPAPSTIIQTLSFIISLLWQEASGVSDVLPLLTRVRPTLNGKKNSPPPEKVFLALTQDEVTDGDHFRLLSEFRELIDKQQQLSKEKENHSSFYIAMINQELRAVVAPGQVIPELLFSFIRHWLLDAELVLYLRILPEADWLDLLPELEAIASASPASAAAGDDGDPDREPDNDPEPALFIAGELGVQPWIAGLYSQAVLQKQRLLRILRQRVRQAIARGNHILAQILRNRIMVIKADLSNLKSSESQVSDNLELQALLLEGLLENSDEVRAYETGNLTVEAPTGKKESASGGEGAASQNDPSKEQTLPVLDRKPEAFLHNSGSSDDDPEPEQLQHTYNNQPCPVCRADICKETEPGSAKELGISNQRHILTLPTEILLYIFEYTNLSDRIAIMQCCRCFEEIAANEIQIRIWFQEYIPDILFPMGKAMSAALEAKTHGFFKNASPVIKRTLANFYALAPSICTHTMIWFCKIKCVATFPDDRIISGNLFGQVNVWRINEDGEGFCIHTLAGHDSSITSIATLSDRWLISGSLNGSIFIWHLKSPQKIYCTYMRRVFEKKISSIETLPDMRFYVGSIDGKVSVWRLTEAGKALRQHTLSVPDEVSCLKVLPEGELFAGTCCGKINFWKTTKTNELSLEKTWKAHGERIICIEMSPDDRLLTCSDKSEIKSWDLNNPELSCITYCADKPLSFRDVMCGKISPEGQMILCTIPPEMKIFTFRNGKVDSVCTLKKDDQITSIAFMQDGRMVTGFNSGKIGVWDYADTRHSKQP